jgi:hypothetical protein
VRRIFLKRELATPIGAQPHTSKALRNCRVGQLNPATLHRDDIRNTGVLLHGDLHITLTCSILTSGFSSMWS